MTDAELEEANKVKEERKRAKEEKKKSAAPASGQAAASTTKKKKPKGPKTGAPDLLTAEERMNEFMKSKFNL
jgi:hypothetical protein